jgi:hypothetical protein
MRLWTASLGVIACWDFEGRRKSENTCKIGQRLPANRAYACNSAAVEDFLPN